MSDTEILQQVEPLVDQLSSTDKLRLVEHIVRNLLTPNPQPQAAVQTRPGWSSLRGIARGLLDGEDAQAWVTRSRSESDSARDEQLKARS